jgi:hypothetical protein
MRTSLAGRIRKLEGTQKQGAPRSSVIHYNPKTDEILGVPRMAQKVMLVPVWPSDQAWEAALLKHQQRLVACA